MCDHRHRRLFTLKGPVHVVCKLAHCPKPACPAHSQTRSPEAETALAMPWWVLGWDVVCWLGHRRFARHWSVGQIRAELADTYMIRLSDDAIERSIHRDQRMVAARQHDPQRLAAAYADVDAVILSIDGLQPEKGHETLYVVRELARRRVWCAEALLSRTTAEVQQLLAQARSWAERLGKPVRLGRSEKQAAFVRGIAAEFPGVPHRSCANHFLRDVAQPVLAAASHAKVQMRRKVRGLRTIERAVGATRRPAAPALRATAAQPTCHLQMSYSITVPRSAVSSTMIKGAPSIHRACAWPGRSLRSRPHSSGISRCKRGVYSRASRALSGRH